jgi:hypothetical protein
MNEYDHEEENDFEVPNIERLLNIPVVDLDEPLHEILTELKRVRRDGDGGGNKTINTKLDYKKPKHPISEYISFRDRLNDKTWGVVIYLEPLTDLAIAVMDHTGLTPEETESCLRQYFTQRETFHFYVDRAVYALENSFNLYFTTKHDLWEPQCRNRLYKYPQIEIHAAEYFAMKMTPTGAAKVFTFLKKVGHISADSMNTQNKYGTHRELHSWLLSQYLKSDCLINDRIVGIEGLLGLDNDGLGGTPSIKLSDTDKRVPPTQMPRRDA